MDSVFSTLHSKRGAINEESIATLNFDLDLVRINWHEMNQAQKITILSVFFLVVRK